MLRIKEICKKKNLTIAFVAQEMGMLPPALSRIINGSNTTTDTLQRIASVLNVPISELFTEPATDILLCPYCGNKIKVSKDCCAEMQGGEPQLFQPDEPEEPQPDEPQETDE